MATTETGSLQLNYRGATARRLFLDPVFMDLAAQDIFGIMPNVNSQQRMYFASELFDVLQKHEGCGFTPKGKLDIYKRQISTTRVKADVRECWFEFENTIHMEALRSGLDVSDMRDTEMMNLLLKRVQQSVKKHINKLAFFGNTASTDDSANLLNGMFPVYIKQGVDANVIQRIDSESGTALAAGESIDILDRVYESAPNELKAFNKADRMMLVSNNIAEGLETDIRNNVVGDASFKQMTQEGDNIMMFRGIRIVPMYRWEALSQQYFTGAENAKLVIYTVKNNMVLATNNQSDMNQFRVRYDEFEELTDLKAAFALGFNYIHNQLLTVAY